MATFQHLQVQVMDKCDITEHIHSGQHSCNQMNILVLLSAYHTFSGCSKEWDFHYDANLFIISVMIILYIFLVTENKVKHQ
jgi:hypothetical protein